MAASRESTRLASYYRIVRREEARGRVPLHVEKQPRPKRDRLEHGARSRHDRRRVVVQGLSAIHAVVTGRAHAQAASSEAAQVWP